MLKINNLCSHLRACASKRDFRKSVEVYGRISVKERDTIPDIIPLARPLSLRLGSTIVAQVRWCRHIEFPDFSKYRRSSVKSPEAKSSDSVDSRRLYTYLVGGAAGVLSAYGTKSVLLQYVLYMGASKDVLALARIEVKLGDIPEGKSVAVKWRGKPLVITHRTPDEIEKVRAVDIKTLRDPEKDEDRTKRAEWLVVVGICTHLGCVPLAGQGDFGGFYCPCHGSHFDASGRARKGPAPTNMEVPEYFFSEENTLVVG